jgi:hypothetical protein
MKILGYMQQSTISQTFNLNKKLTHDDNIKYIQINTKFVIPLVGTLKNFEYFFGC